MKKVDIVIPAHNEEKIIESSLNNLYSCLKKIKDVDWRVVIGENGSSDNTYKFAKSLIKKFPKLKVYHINKASRDLTLKYLWEKSKADVLVYTDADMSTNPKHIRQMIDYILEGYDIAVGSRLINGAKVKRPLSRVILSSIYNLILLPFFLPTGVRDTQNGFKAINQKIARELLPKLSEENALLDMELMAVAYYKKYKVIEFPVEWVEADRKSTMNVNKNILNFLKNIIKTRLRIMRGYYN